MKINKRLINYAMKKANKEHFELMIQECIDKGDMPMGLVLLCNKAIKFGKAELVLTDGTLKLEFVKK